MAAPASDLNLILDSLRAQLTLRTNELLDSRGEVSRLSAQLSASTMQIDQNESQFRALIEAQTKLAKERETGMLAELAARDAEISRLRNQIAQTLENSLQVERECEEKLRAQSLRLNAMRSRCDDIADNFGEMLQALLTRMQKVVPLVEATTSGDLKKAAGQEIGEGLQVASSELIAKMTVEAEKLTAVKK